MNRSLPDCIDLSLRLSLSLCLFLSSHILSSTPPLSPLSPPPLFIKLSFTLRIFFPHSSSVMVSLCPSPLGLFPRCVSPEGKLKTEAVKGTRPQNAHFGRSSSKHMTARLRGSSALPPSNNHSPSSPCDRAGIEALGGPAADT